MARHIYESGLDKNPANFVPLSPITFLDWAADLAGPRPAVIHGERVITWAETRTRSRRLASALGRLGVGRGDTVAAMLSNTPEMYEAHFGVPMAGAILNPINTRLEAETVAFILAHAEAKVLLTDREFSPVVAKALAATTAKPLVIDVDDPEYLGEGRRLGRLDYEALLADGDPAFGGLVPNDEWDAISLNYTSGTTGNPKGVVYHHRGAYLAALGNVVAWEIPRFVKYLWTLPMFHANGWCITWALASVAGTSICLRKVDPEAIFNLIRRHRVTHYCGAPIVHSTMINTPPAIRAGIDHQLHAMVAGAAPPAAMLAGAEAAGIDITHVYGLTEVYGPATACFKQDDWAEQPPAERARLNGRQGIRYPVAEGFTVLDPDTMLPVPPDGVTVGEIMFRGNLTMKGYLKNEAATQEAFAGGWFHSGDLAVVHPDGYVKIKDRSKDIIISGGENVSSLEIEDVLHHHPAVLAAAVVAQPDPKWGETPCAYVELRPDFVATAEDLAAHCRKHLAGFKLPKTFVFGPLPRTSTGKIQKYVLRARADSASAIE